MNAGFNTDAKQPFRPWHDDDTWQYSKQHETCSSPFRLLLHGSASGSLTVSFKHFASIHRHCSLPLTAATQPDDSIRELTADQSRVDGADVPAAARRLSWPPLKRRTKKRTKNITDNFVTQYMNQTPNLIEI
jgi:hypothetical protein